MGEAGSIRHSRTEYDKEVFCEIIKIKEKERHCRAGQNSRPAMSTVSIPVH